MAAGESAVDCHTIIEGDVSRHYLHVQDLEETKREAAQVVELLDLRQGGLTQTLDGGFPELRTSVWQSEISVQTAVQVRSIAPAGPLLTRRQRLGFPFLCSWDPSAVRVGAPW